MIECYIPTLERTIDGRRCMRSVADAIEALSQAQLLRNTCLEIRTGSFPGLSGGGPALVFVICPAPTLEQTWGVALPTSFEFIGRPVGEEAAKTFDIALLDRATVEMDGTVRLADGVRLQAVSVVPAALPWKLTKLQKRIIYAAIKFIGAEDKCYRYGPPSPDLAWLDFGALHNLALPKLESIVHYIAQNNPRWKINRQTVANALGIAGMRVPRDRSHA